MAKNLAGTSHSDGELDDSRYKINGKIQLAAKMKVHTMLVIGNRDLEASAVSVRVHGKGDLDPQSREKMTASLLKAIRERWS